jgi:hypothetical protein
LSEGILCILNTALTRFDKIVQLGFLLIGQVCLISVGAKQGLLAAAKLLLRGAHCRVTRVNDIVQLGFLICCEGPAVECFDLANEFLRHVFGRRVVVGSMVRAIFQTFPVSCMVIPIKALLLINLMSLSVITACLSYTVFRSIARLSASVFSVALATLIALLAPALLTLSLLTTTRLTALTTTAFATTAR